jgi:helix-turn-helix protein
MCVNPVEVGRMESMRRAVFLKDLRARYEIEDVERKERESIERGEEAFRLWRIGEERRYPVVYCTRRWMEDMKHLVRIDNDSNPEDY